MKRILLAVAALGLLSCGEMPTRKSVPEGSRQICIPVLVNKTDQPGLDVLLTKKVVQNFIVDGRLRVSPREQADLLLQGTLERYDRLVLTRDASQVPQQYKLQLVVNLELIDLKSGRQLWTTRPLVSLTPGGEVKEDAFDSTNTRALRESTNYYVLNVAGVPPEDEPTAQDRLLEQAASRILTRTVDGF